VIIDHLRFIEPENIRAPHDEQVATITRSLRTLAKELNIPILLIVQIERPSHVREDKRPRLADLRESGAIEQDADLVMFLHRPDAYQADDRPGEAELIIAKHRSGPTGIVTLTWRKEFMKFEDFSPLREPAGGYFAPSSGS
jgi:replicative DNA helicase